MIFDLKSDRVGVRDGVIPSRNESTEGKEVEYKIESTTNTTFLVIQRGIRSVLTRRIVKSKVVGETYLHSIYELEDWSSTMS